MDVKKQLPLKGKRHEFVRFIASLIPTLQINTDGQIQLEFGVVDFLVEKVQKVVAKKKEKKEQQERELKPQDSTREGEEPEEPKPHDSTSEGEEQEELKPHDSIREDEAKQEELESSAAGREDEVKQEEPESDDAAKKDERKQEEPELGGEAGEDEGKQEEPELSGAAREDEGEQETPKSNGAANEEINQENEHDKYSRKAEDQQLDESLEDTVQRLKPHTTWDDVAGLQNAKWQLQIAAEMPEKQPALFMGKRKAPQFILLYGPPGTGKGHLAKALSNSVDSTLFIVSASDITSMWHGQSERLVRLLFKRARRHKPAIVFFDEIDALCSNRKNDSADHEIRVKSELLVQMDGLNADNSGVLFLAATNLPWNIDPAFIRRFQKRIEVPLPDELARERLFELEIGGTLCDLSPDDYKDLAKESEGFSGSDIKTVVQDALNCPITKVIEATHFSEDAQNNFLPCEPTDEGAKRMNWRDIPKDKLGNLPVTREDFFKALRQSKPSVDPDNIENYSKWTAKHGMNGA